jgi:signal transduction histidine kinase
MSLLGKSPGLGAHEQAYAAMAEDELRRVVHLTQQSLSFYRESTHAVVVNVEEVLDSVVNLYVKRLKTEDITVVKRYRSEATTINSYPGEIRQVFSTVLVNAMEATAGGGTISIRTRKSSQTKTFPAQGVRISIVDNGVGIPAHDTASIFAFLYHQGRARDRPWPLGGQRDYKPAWRLDPNAQQHASGQARDLFFDFSPQPTAKQNLVHGTRAKAACFLSPRR